MPDSRHLINTAINFVAKSMDLPKTGKRCAFLEKDALKKKVFWEPWILSHLYSWLNVEAVAGTKYKFSPKAWRVEPRPHFSSKNSAQETLLERLIIKHNDGTWINQIPIVGSGAGNIDLCQKTNTTLKIYELKVESDNPAFATVELLVYGCLYLIAKKNNIANNDYWKCRRLELKVLAPQRFYEGWNKLAETELEINSDIIAFLVQLQLAGSLEMNFQYNYLSTLPVGRLTRENLDSKPTIEGIVSGIRHLSELTIKRP